MTVYPVAARDDRESLELSYFLAIFLTFDLFLIGFFGPCQYLACARARGSRRDPGRPEHLRYHLIGLPSSTTTDGSFALRTCSTTPVGFFALMRLTAGATSLVSHR